MAPGQQVSAVPTKKIWENPPMKTQLFAAAAAAALTVSLGTSAAFASCESGEIVVKFAHVVAAKGSPKGATAPALAARVNTDMSSKARRVGNEGGSPRDSGWWP